MNESIRKKIRPLYWNFRKVFLNNIIVSKYLLRRILTDKDENQICPICNSNSITSLNFHFEQTNIIKFFCKNCGHIFTNNLRRNVHKGFELFNYGSENEHINDQKYLLLLLERETRNYKTKNRRLLDFGIGGNYSHLIELNRYFNDVAFEGCDIYPSDKKFYFQAYADESKIGIFDGIVSNAVIEHLDDTVNSWKYLNTLLKPVDERGGIMIHAFPSQINEDYLHWAIQIKSHECLFSKKSLLINCHRTGFQLLKIKFSPFVQHPIFYFKKISDI